MRLNSLKKIATTESVHWLKQNERFLCKEKLDDDYLKEAKKFVDSVRNE